MYAVWIDMKTYGCSYRMPTLDSGGAGIDIKSIVVRVPHNLQYMRMAAHENVRFVGIQHRGHIKGIMPGRSTDMSHQNLMAFAVEKLHLGAVEADFLCIAISVNPNERLERGNAVDKRNVAAKIAGMPDFIDRGKKVLELGAEYSVSIGYDSYVHTICDGNKLPLQPQWLRFQYGDVILQDG